jgi:hypothetical protein
MGSFLVTVLLGAWLLPGAWLSGATVGLGVGLLISSVVHLRATRGTATRSEDPMNATTEAIMTPRSGHPVLSVLEPRFPTIYPDHASRVDRTVGRDEQVEQVERAS